MGIRKNDGKTDEDKAREDAEPNESNTAENDKSKAANPVKDRFSDPELKHEPVDDDVTQDKNTGLVDDHGDKRSPDSYVKNIPVRKEVVENDSTAGIRFTIEVPLAPFEPGAATDEQVVELARQALGKKFPTVNLRWEHLDDFDWEADTESDDERDRRQDLDKSPLSSEYKADKIEDQEARGNKTKK